LGSNLSAEPRLVFSTQKEQHVIFENEAVEVSYAGQKVRGWAVKVEAGLVTVETEFGVRTYKQSEVTGLRFMRAA
jgi:hypothetical protein